MRLFSLKNANPIGGFGSFIEYWKQPTPYRWQILGVSVALTFTLMVLLAPKTERAPPEKMQVTWITSWPEGRTEQEILASNIANQKRKDERAAIEKQRQDLRREFYRKLARASGMDPDELEREFASKPAAKAPAKAPTAAAPAPAKPAGTPAQ